MAAGGRHSFHSFRFDDIAREARYNRTINHATNDEHMSYRNNMIDNAL